MKRIHYIICIAFFGIITTSVVIGGCLTLQIEHQKKTSMMRQIKSCEIKVKQLNRKNDELTLKIAQAQSPEILKKRSSQLVQTSSKTIVWAQADFEKSKLAEMSDQKNTAISFKPHNQDQIQR